MFDVSATLNDEFGTGFEHVAPGRAQYETGDDECQPSDDADTATDLGRP